MTDQLSRSTGTAAPLRTRATNDFTELARIVAASGFMRRRYGYYWSKLVGLATVLTAVLVAFVLIGDTWWQVVTAAVFAALFTQIAMLGHDAAHRQIFVSGRWNDWTSIVIGNLLVGMSYGWWQHKHTRHHANPNKIGSDPDIELPVISVTADQAGERAKHYGQPLAWLMAHQGIFFYPILLLEGMSLHASSVRRVLSRAPMRRRAAETVFLAVRIGGYLALVFLVLSPGIAAVFLAVQLGLFGVYMGMSFAPNHKGMPLVPATVKIDFLRRQVLMSRNIRGNRLLDVAMGGLNYQIEHHLFPSMPRPHLRAASATIKAYCLSHGVRYTETGLWESYRIVTHYINRVGLGERDPFECPLLLQRQTG
ncbi:fatty acid desaturase family protein [Microbacterium invictum]|uniref:Fatty acid desaturase n=1 Tax=Microbacterium invictum TaxID=515415 RepID=A0AA40SQG9_9MICO|nr:MULTISPECIES: acyl-CoA desaturase [Microbacterium]MBB4140496.1 fatty acid desaturase [Microbacterium invictum]